MARIIKVKKRNTVTQYPCNAHKLMKTVSDISQQSQVPMYFLLSIHCAEKAALVAKASKYGWNDSVKFSSRYPISAVPIIQKTTLMAHNFLLVCSIALVSLKVRLSRSLDRLEMVRASDLVH